MACSRQSRGFWSAICLAAGGLMGWGSLLPVGHAADPQPPPVVYGVDNRQEVYSLRGADARNAAGTVALVRESSIKPNGDGSFRLVAPTLGSAYDLCPGERFRTQPTAAFCSGFLAAKNIVVTAGHCVGPISLASARFVFGYRVLASGAVQTRIPASAIYRGVRLLADQEGAADFAVIRLDRNVTSQTPLPFRRTSALALNSAIYVIGYPSGLPEKVAAGARILASNRDFFTANLDTFGGNSGSPVFDAASDTVVGVLVRGATDYVRRGGCWVPNVLPNSSGSEESTRTTRIAPFVPLGG